MNFIKGKLHINNAEAAISFPRAYFGSSWSYTYKFQSSFFRTEEWKLSVTSALKITSDFGHSLHM